MRPNPWIGILVGLVALAVAGPAQAAFPGANGKIVFTRDAEIYTMNPDGTGQARLSTPRQGHSPAWSPNGTKIAFMGPGSTFEIYTVNADGSHLRHVTPADPAVDTSPAWSPDGKKIAFASARAHPTGFDIYTINPDGTGLTQLTNGGDNHEPSWSPDGTKIAFERNLRYPDFSGWEIVTMNPDGTDQTSITAGLDPNWSPDGRRLTFTADRPYDVYVINLDATGRINLSNDPAEDYEPVWSPDGTKIAFHSDRHPVFGPGEIYSMNADGTEVKNLTQNSIPDARPDWQPLFFCSGVAGTIIGTPGDDYLRGTTGDDVIVGLGGNDTISGLEGNDTICGDDGNDRLLGWAGDDALFGLAGDDVLIGHEGADTLNGGADVDAASYAGRPAGVTVDIDNVADDGNSDDGPAGARDNVRSDIEKLIGGTGADTLIGSTGDDEFDGRKGPDVLIGLGGSDIATYVNRTGRLTVDIDGVADDGNASDGPAGARDNVMTDIEKLIGGSGPDTLTGSAASNVLTGGLGSDTLLGLAGNDTLLANDGTADARIDCDGGSNDTALVDGADPVAVRCETVGP